MPIKIIEGLPVREKLREERIFTIEESRAHTQDIRPLRILILNLMPLKQATERQFLRLLGNSPIQIDVDFLYTASYESSNTPTSYLQEYYQSFDQVKEQFYDGLLVTGAPVEKMPFEDVDYYQELRDIMTWAQTHVFNRYFVCWGAQFALNYYYGIEKELLDEKLFGVYPYRTLNFEHPYVRGFDDVFHVPHSRHTRMNAEQILQVEGLEVLTGHEVFGPDLMVSQDGRDVFIFGHLEYDRETLSLEYHRDLHRGDRIALPENYFPDDDVNRLPVFNWRSHGHLLMHNWINETYQETPYNLEELLSW
ncbi:homoserine O-succinyltransferase [Suicoccus acidiformans]|uniref:Homoserine O-acetyltransferase n=1 Tax=Suicoccus acidiformans TaxID=2036206 RepID=A0A347WLT8_9LACT|nr:homoserine O-succinyltransferase [Suicoccus acidiformans]AXY26045.1 homoserine O-succinyltransferase [Suicoccus acidiformans]